MIQVSNIHKSFGSLQVLKGVDLSVKTAEILSITGASGAGKTSLLQIIGSLDKADEGEVQIDEICVSKLNKKSLSVFRNQTIGFIFQFHHLLAEFTALENIVLPALIGKKDRQVAEKRALELLSFLGLKERAHHKPSELSGGEQQRIAVARALINNPSVILADEPSGNLDSYNATKLHELFFKLRDEFGQSYLIVTHNDVLADFSDRKVLMKDGLILAQS
ncbi:MAG: ABC transporter ATP-binding protein [Bacteroidales bacterium]